MAELLGQAEQTVDVRLKIAKHIGTRDKLDEAAAIFAEIDADGSGELDLEEFQTAISRFDANISREDAASIFKLSDADHSGELDLGEFQALQKNGLELLDMAKHLVDSPTTKGRIPGTTMRAMARMAKALDSGVRLQRTDSACNPKMQGDIAMLDPATLKLRKDLKKNPKMHAIIYGWWKKLDLNEHLEMKKEHYREISIALHLMLDPDATHEVLVKTADQDWVDDVKKYGQHEEGADSSELTLSFFGFFESMFEMMDTWVDTIDENDYDEFAKKMQRAHEDYQKQTAGLSASQKEQQLAHLGDLSGVNKERLASLVGKLGAADKACLLDVLDDLDKEKKAVFFEVMDEMDLQEQARATRGMGKLNAKDKKAMLTVLSDLDKGSKKQMLHVMDDLNEQQAQELVRAMEAMSDGGRKAILDVMSDIDVNQKAALMDVMGQLSQNDKAKLLGAMGSMTQAGRGAMLNAMGGLDHEQQAQLLGLAGDLASGGQQQLVMALDSIGDEGKTAMLNVMSDLSAAEKGQLLYVMDGLDNQDKKQAVMLLDSLEGECMRRTVAVMAKLDAKQTKAYLDAAVKLTTDEHCLMTGLLDGLVGSDRAAFLTAAAGLDRDALLVLIQQFAQGKHKKKCGTYCSCCSANFFASYAFVKDTYALPCTPGGTSVYATNSISTAIGDPQGLAIVGQSNPTACPTAIPTDTRTRSKRTFTTTTAAVTGASTTLELNAGAVPRTTLTQVGGDGSTTTVVIAQDGTSDVVFQASPSPQPEPQPTPDKTALKLLVVDKAAIQSMTTRARRMRHESNGHEDGLYTKLKALKKLGVFRCPKTSSTPVVDCSVMLRSLAQRKSMPGEPRDKAVARMRATLKRADYITELATSSKSKRRRARAQLVQGVYQRTFPTAMTVPTTRQRPTPLRQYRRQLHKCSPAASSTTRSTKQRKSASKRVWPEEQGQWRNTARRPDDVVERFAAVASAKGLADVRRGVAHRPRVALLHVDRRSVYQLGGPPKSTSSSLLRRASIPHLGGRRARAGMQALLPKGGTEPKRSAQGRCDHLPQI
jgi:hypothetical protein